MNPWNAHGLDDPRPPAVGPKQRATVARRVRAIRLRRASIALGTALGLSVGGTVALASPHLGVSLRDHLGIGQPVSGGTQQPAHRVAPHRPPSRPTPAPTAMAVGPGSPQFAATRRTAPTAPAPAPATRPAALRACGQPITPVGTGMVTAELTAPPAARAAAGDALSVTFALDNTGGRPVDFDLAGDDVVALSDSTGDVITQPAAAIAPAPPAPGTSSSSTVHLRPGQSVTVSSRDAITSTCSGDPVRPGSYLLRIGIRVHPFDAATGASLPAYMAWTPPVPLTVTGREQPTPAPSPTDSGSPTPAPSTRPSGSPSPSPASGDSPSPTTPPKPVPTGSPGPGS